MPQFAAGTEAALADHLIGGAGSPSSPIVAMAREAGQCRMSGWILVQMVLAESESRDGLDLELMEVLDSKSEPSRVRSPCPRTMLLWAVKPQFLVR